jgi:Tol biopolymer transport system component
MAGWIVATALAIALVLLGAPWLTSRGVAAPSFARLVRLTNGSAREWAPAISRDGKWVAYLSDAGGTVNVWIKFLAGGAPSNLTERLGLELTTGGAQGGLEFSPDGTSVAVTARPAGSTGSFETWAIPAPLPGSGQGASIARRVLLQKRGLGIRWSPEGGQFVAVAPGGLAGDGLIVADRDGSNVRDLVKAQEGWHLHWPAWSSDGHIYFIRTITTVTINGEPSEIYRVPAQGGAIEPVVETTRRAIHPFPTLDGSGLIYSANPDAAGLNLWWRPIEGGTPRRLTMGIGEYAEPRLSADGKTLICAVYDVRESLVRIPLAPKAGVSQIALTEGFGGDLDPHVSRKGRLVFSSTREGNRHLWIAQDDGRGPRALTSGRFVDERPAFSPDDEQIAFVSDRSGRRAIWVVNTNGENLRKVADAPLLDTVLTWSPDMKQIVFMAGAGDFPGLWTASVADGQILRLPTPGAGAEPAWSVERKVLAYLDPGTTNPPPPTRLAFLDAAGVPLYTMLPPPPGVAGFTNGMPAWSPDGRRVAVLSQNANTPSSIWIVDLEAREPEYRQLHEFAPSVKIRGITWTADGLAILAGKQEASSKIVLMDQGQ